MATQIAIAKPPPRLLGIGKIRNSRESETHSARRNNGELIANWRGLVVIGKGYTERDTD